MRAIRRSALAGGAVLVLAACSGGTAEEAATQATPAETAAEATPAAPAPTDGSEPSAEGAANADVLAFTAPDLDGGTVDAAQYAGRDVILWMWAPW